MVQLNLKRQKLPIQRPSVRMPPHSHSTAQHFIFTVGEHAKYMSELEEWALEAENRSQQDFLSPHLVVLHHAPPSLKEDLHSSYNILLGNSLSPLQSDPSARASQSQGRPPATTSPKSEPTQSQWLKRQNPSPDLQGDMVIDEDSPRGSQEDLPCSKREKISDWFSSLKPSRANAFCQDSSPIKEARECYFATHPWDWVRAIRMICPTFSGSLLKALACWANPFMKYNNHGMDQII